MSRVGSSPVEIPEGADVQITGQMISAKGKLGQMSVNIPTDIEITQEDGDYRCWLSCRGAGPVPEPAAWLFPRCELSDPRRDRHQV